MIGTAKMFVVALPRFKERFHHAQVQCSRFPELSPEIIGVDGAAPGLVAMRATRNFLPGAVGCTLSHVEIYRKIVEADYRCALVIEDDTILPNDLLEILDTVVKTLDSGEVISLYSRTIGVARFTTDSITPAGVRALYYPLDARHVRTTAAYVIGQDAARRIAEGNDPVRFLADDWANFYNSGWIDSIRVLLPSPIKLTSQESTIEIGDGKGVIGRLRKLIKLVPALKSIRDRHRKLLLSQQEQDYVIVDQPLPIDVKRNGRG